MTAHRWVLMQAKAAFLGYKDMNAALLNASPKDPDAVIAEYARQTEAVRRALVFFDEHECDMLRRSIMDGVPLTHINAPMSVRTMQRRKAAFLRTLARELRLLF